MNLLNTFQSKNKELRALAVKLAGVGVADDVMQEVHLKILNMETGPAKPFEYLVSSVRNVALNSQRNYAGVVWGTPELVDDFSVLEQLSDDALPDSRLEFLESEHSKNLKLEQVRDALKQLKPKQRAVVEAYMAGLTPYEYARTAGLNKFTTAVNFKCGIQKLQKLLGVIK